MTITFVLAFPQHAGNIAGKPTYFAEKIWTGLPLELYQQCVDGDYERKFYEQFGYPPGPLTPMPKKHTIRLDEKGRWQPGKLLHFKSWTGKPYNSPTFPIAPTALVTSVQSISIEWLEKGFAHYTKNGRCPVVKIDGDYYWSGFDHDQGLMKALAWNDGFDTVEDFFEWFSEDFSGKIIHWTDFSYKNHSYENRPN